MQLEKRGFKLVETLINDKRKVSVLSSADDNRFSGGLRNSTVEWNPNKTDGGWNVRGNADRPSFIGLGHEFAHVEGFWTRRAANDGIWPGTNGTSILEQYATHVENQLRSEFGIPLRTHYSLQQANGQIKGGDPTTRILDVNNNSLFYRQELKYTNPLNGKSTIIIGGFPFRY